jgi:spore germination protein
MRGHSLLNRLLWLFFRVEKRGAVQMKCLQYLFLGLFLSLLSGCWGQLDIEKINPDLQLGIESVGNGGILLTACHPVFGADGKLKDNFVTVKTDILREARQTVLRGAYQIPQAGKLQQLLVSEGLARQGIAPWLDVFVRNPLDPPIAAIVVVDGSPKTLIEKAQGFKEQPISALYLQNLLENNRDQYVSVPSIASFVCKYFAPGLDPVAPIIKLGPKEIWITGTALFCDDRMAGSITPEQGTLLLALMGKLRSVDYIFHHINSIGGDKGSKLSAAARIVKVKRKMKIRICNERSQVMIRLNFSGVLTEYHWDQIDLPKRQKKLEQYFAGELTAGCNRLVRNLQQVGSDPLGIGDLIRAEFPSYWKHHDPKQLYQTARIQVGTQFKITGYGNIK